MKNPLDRLARRARSGLALLALGAVLTACIDDESHTLFEPDGGALFQRYVALGNSITAGFQSGGINIELQQEAYPVLLAEKAGAPFGIPALAMPGCPPPYLAPLSTERAGGATCALRISPGPAVVQNLAVPGATAAHVLHPVGTGTTLNTLILGGRTQAAAMIDARPSLVSVWIGNNDALSAALSGDPSQLTPLESFQATYDQIVMSINESTAREAILIGVANAALMAPALQPGAYFWVIGQPPSPFAEVLDVDDSCAPGTAGGSRLVSFQGVLVQLDDSPAGPVVINCHEDAPFLLNAAELQEISAAVAAFNAHIRARAEENGWLYIDPMEDFFLPAFPDPDLVRKCQGLATAATPEQIAAAVQNTCPSLSAPNFFGAYFSFDGVHPSARGHIAIAQAIAVALNEEYGLTLPVDE